MTKKQRKSSRAWCLGRTRGAKKNSEHRRFRRFLRKRAIEAAKGGDLAEAARVHQAVKRAVAFGANLLGRAREAVRRNGSRGA